MKPMHIITLLLTILIACNPGTEKKETANSSEAEEWIHLFNGKNLDGWTIKMNKYPMN